MDTQKDEQYYQELAQKWLDGRISPGEEREFSDWYNSRQDREVVIPDTLARNDDELRQKMFKAIKAGIRPSRQILYRRIAYPAAAVVLIASLVIALNRGGYRDDEPAAVAKAHSPVAGENNTIHRQNSEKYTVPVNDIAPGTDKAILILGDGTRIVLDDDKEGIVAGQGKHTIVKAAKGGLIYSVSAPSELSGESGRMEFNTVETPRGGKFHVVLPDGSKVWLNAASSLRFPTRFDSDKRQVELRGEAYFEVAHDAAHLFEVVTGNQIVHVLGTHFNINAYSDEPTTNTTLLEGSVKISGRQKNISTLLRPGEQAKLSDDIEIVSVGDVKQAVAWKEGYFEFDESDITTVMRQLGRWYDVSVRYEGEVPLQRFGGEIERSLSLSQVLSILRKTGVNFRLEGKEVVVMP